MKKLILLLLPLITMSCNSPVQSQGGTDGKIQISGKIENTGAENIVLSKIVNNNKEDMQQLLPDINTIDKLKKRTIFFYFFKLKKEDTSESDVKRAFS
ncbi:MAG: hypothetical protein KTR26_16220, partial [Flammeovirgaceae bacterium]|nr:hypothetical protein [Flammeovirgaceae bacterium]